MHHRWQIDELLQTKGKFFIHFSFDFSICIAIGQVFPPHDGDDKYSVCSDCVGVYLRRDCE